VSLEKLAKKLEGNRENTVPFELVPFQIQLKNRLAYWLSIRLMVLPLFAFAVCGLGLPSALRNAWGWIPKLF